MSDETKEGAIVPSPPDDNPANIRSGPAGSLSSLPDTRFLYEKGEGEELDADDAYRAIIDQILSAETPDTILTPVEVLQPRDVVMSLLDIYDVRWQRSEFEVGSPMYASIEAKRIADDKSVVVNCGQKRVMAQLVRLRQLADANPDKYGWPFRAYFEETGQNTHGSPMYRLTSETAGQQEQMPF